MMATSLPLTAGVGHLVVAADTAVDARAARELLLDVTGSLELRQPGNGSSPLTYGPLASIAAVTREAVYVRLDRLREARQRVTVTSDDSEAAVSLVTVLNVLLAADAARDVERSYADVERSAMVAAVVAGLRGDELHVTQARDALVSAAKEALAVLEHGAVPGAVGAAAVPRPLELMRDELVARLRGEVSTNAFAFTELAAATRFLVDVDQEWNCTYGPLWWDHPDLYEIRAGVHHHLGQLYVARRATWDRPWPRTADEISTRLVELLNVVASADAAATVAVAYEDAERRAMAGAAIAHLRGDELGLTQARDALRRAAADALDGWRKLVLEHHPTRILVTKWLSARL